MKIPLIVVLTLTLLSVFVHSLSGTSCYPPLVTLIVTAGFAWFAVAAFPCDSKEEKNAMNLHWLSIFYAGVTSCLVTFAGLFFNVKLITSAGFILQIFCFMWIAISLPTGRLMLPFIRHKLKLT
jgi:hypothetical protein